MATLPKHLHGELCDAKNHSQHLANVALNLIYNQSKNFDKQREYIADLIIEVKESDKEKIRDDMYFLILNDALPKGLKTSGRVFIKQTDATTMIYRLIFLDGNLYDEWFQSLPL